MGRQNEIEQEIEFQPFNITPSSRVVNDTTLTRTFYTPTSGIICACVIVLLLFSNCVLLGRVASGIQGTNSELQVQRQILQNLHLGNGTSFYYTPPSPSSPPPSPPSPSPLPPPPPPVLEHKYVPIYNSTYWNSTLIELGIETVGNTKACEEDLPEWWGWRKAKGYPNTEYANLKKLGSCWVEKYLDAMSKQSWKLHTYSHFAISSAQYDISWHPPYAYFQFIFTREKV